MKKNVLLIVILFSASACMSAQTASLLQVADCRNVTTNDVPYSSNQVIRAELKPTTSLGLADYYYGINLALSPHSNGGWGYEYQLNFNWNGMYFRRGSEAWDPWWKLIMQNVWGDVRIDRDLDVCNRVRTKEVIVDNGTGWADFVFAQDYQLSPLCEVKQYIDENKRLPGMPAEAEVNANGVNLGEMQVKLLQKIEELTLYVIQLQETVEKQNIKIEQLENK